VHSKLTNMCWLPLCSAGWVVLVFIIGGLPLLLVIGVVYCRRRFGYTRRGGL